MPYNDRFFHDTMQLDSPLVDGTAVDTSGGDVALNDITRAVWVGGAGDLKVIFSSGNTRTIVGVPAGTLLPIRIRAVIQVGTNATGILALT